MADGSPSLVNHDFGGADHRQSYVYTVVAAGGRVVEAWVLLGILILGVLYVFPRIPAALISGEVPLNPLGWFGYGELAEVSIDRRGYPFAYWLIVLSLTALVVLFALFIYVVVFHSPS
jgi:hypothetical protein